MQKCCANYSDDENIVLKILMFWYLLKYILVMKCLKKLLLWILKFVKLKRNNISFSLIYFHYACSLLLFNAIVKKMLFFFFYITLKELITLFIKFYFLRGLLMKNRDPILHWASLSYLVTCLTGSKLLKLFLKKKNNNIFSFHFL